MGNCVVACMTCNQARGDTPVPEWLTSKELAEIRRLGPDGYWAKLQEERAKMRAVEGPVEEALADAARKIGPGWKIAAITRSTWPDLWEVSAMRLDNSLAFPDWLRASGETLESALTDLVRRAQETADG